MDHRFAGPIAQPMASSLSCRALPATHTSSMERSDAELLAASRRGERAAFAQLVERYQGVVCAVSYSGTGDRTLSEDVAQDTFLAAWRQLDQLREVERLRAWLCGIARNLAHKARRRRARETPVAEQLEGEHGADLFEQVSDRQAERVVREALHRVPETYREALVLYYHEQRSAKEVAQALGISEAAVLQRLARGRQSLAQGVAALVERALASPLPRRSLVAGVLAALPAITASHASAATTKSTHGGSSMLKLALAAAALTAAGTTAYVTTREGSPAAAPHTATVAPPAAGAAPVASLGSAEAPARAAAAGAASPSASPSTGGKEAGCETCDGSADPDALPPIDRATAARLRLHEGPSRGAAEAPVVITMFTDLQCKYCGQALGTMDQLLEELDGKVRVVVKQFPVRASSELAAQAAFAAEAQGKFWELYDLMMANQDQLSLEGLVELARRAELEVGSFRRALEQGTYRGAVDEVRQVAKELQVMGTPAFVINGRRIAGARPAEVFREHIQSALAERR